MIWFDATWLRFTVCRFLRCLLVNDSFMTAAFITFYLFYQILDECLSLFEET